MAKTTPATIRFKNSSTENVDTFESLSADSPENDFLFDEEYVSRNVNTIRFHAVVSEAHKAANQITKFPVQNGFEISNHAIRKNREVTLIGVFSNVLLQGTQQPKYELTSSNTTKTVFETIKGLVQNAIPCEVVTNLGVYDPVIFTSVNTKQAAGMVDSMEITLKGEEIQVASDVARTGVKQLVFTEVPAADRQSVVDSLLTSGISVPDTAILSQAVANAGESFSFVTSLSSGELFNLEYIHEAWDGISNHTYSVITGNTDVFSVVDDVTNAVNEALNIPLIPTALDLVGGLDRVTNCLFDSGGDAIATEVEKVVDTTLGELDRAVNGAIQDTINLGKDTLQKKLIGTVVDCVAVGFSDAVGYGNKESAEDVVDEILLGVKGVGDKVTRNILGSNSLITNTKERIMTFTKIVSPEERPLEGRGEENEG